MTATRRAEIEAEEIDSLIVAFASRAEVVGVTVERVANWTVAATWLAELQRNLAAPDVLIAGELRDAAPPFIDALNGAEISWQVPRSTAEGRDRPLGVSLASLAVAETGSTLLAETTRADRAVGLLTTTHVTVCRSDAVVPSLVEAAVELRAIASRPGGGYATLVTGPSRTADIELSLTVGVQGPARVFVLFVDDLA